MGDTYFSHARASLRCLALAHTNTSYMHHTNHPTAGTLLWTSTVAVAMLFAACGSDAPQPQTTVNLEPDQGATANAKALLGDDAGLTWNDLAERYNAYAVGNVVTARELRDTKNLFTYCFRKDEGVLYKDTAVAVPWGSIVGTMPPVVAGRTRVLEFHYGAYESAFHMGWAWRYMSDEPNPWSFFPLIPVDGTVDGKIHEWRDGALTSTPMGTWLKTYQTSNAGHSYFSEGEINRLRRSDQNDHWFDLSEEHDTRSYLLHWEDRLQRLYDDNQELYAGKEDFLELMVHCTADWRMDSGVEKVCHTVTVHLRINEPGQPVVDLITDDAVDPARPYRNHGADYGNLCPDRCNSFLRN